METVSSGARGTHSATILPMAKVTCCNQAALLTLLGVQELVSSTLRSVCPVGGGAWSLENACQQASVGDIFLNNTALLGGAVAFMNPASASGRQGLTEPHSSKGPELLLATLYVLAQQAVPA